MKAIITMLCIAMMLSCQKKEQQEQIQYTISPFRLNEVPMLHVNLKFDAIDKDEETKLLFLNDSWGEKELHNVIENISPVDERFVIEMNKDSGWVVVKHPKNSKSIEINYTIKQDFEGELTSKKMYRPIIQEDYFHIFSHSFFMLPLDYIRAGDQKFNVTIAWKNFPENYRIVNTFGHGDRSQSISNTSEEEFMSSVFLGGDYRSYTIPIQNNEVVFSLRDRWTAFEDSTLVTILNKTITAQRDFWNDHSQPYFSVNLTPTAEIHGSSFQGTGLNNAFNCSASNNDNLELDGLIYLFNHELQHNWIGHVIKNKDEEKQYWFSEGFTDYFTFKNIAKYKLNGLDEDYLIDELNSIIKALYTSPVKEAPNNAINYENFWSSRDYEKLPYRRGALFAFYLDHKIRKDSKEEASLDNLMLAIKEDALAGQKLDHIYFVEKANSYLDQDFTPFFKAHIEDGNLMDLKSIFNEFGLEYETRAEVFDQGFEIDKTTNKVAVIDQSSNIYLAGLRQGDQLNGWSIYFGQPDVKSEVYVSKNGKETKLSYYPSKVIELPQIINNANNKQKLRSHE